MIPDRPSHGGNLSWAVSIAGCPTSFLVDFSASINPLGPPAKAIATIKNNLTQLSHYPDPHYHQLRKSLAQYHQINPDCILPGNGSAELLSYVGRELTNYNGAYLLTPAFSDYFRALNSFNVKIKKINLDILDDNYEFKSLYLRLKIDNLDQKSGIIINNPHNPTGKLFKKKEIISYLEKLALVVIDEAFMDFLPDQEQSLISLVRDHPNLIVLRSLTKFYSLAGLRIGYVVTNEERIKKWQKWREPWSVNILADLVAQTVIKDEEFREKTLNWLPPTRLQLLTELSKIEGLTPLVSGVNFLLVKTEVSSVELQEKLLKDYQILIRDCLSFPELGENYFRIAVKLEKDNQKLLNALKLIIGN